MKTILLILCLVVPVSLSAQQEGHVEKEVEHRHEHGSEDPSHAGERKTKPQPHTEDRHSAEKHVGEDRHEKGEEHEEDGAPHKEGEEEEEVSSSVGPGNAVTAANPETGFQLSEEALKTLGIKTKTIPTNSTFPKQAIVTFKDETGVYRLRDGWYKLIEGEIEPQGNGIRFTPNKRQDLRVGDHIVVEGVPLLRVTELDAFSGGEAGHGH